VALTNPGRMKVVGVDDVASPDIAATAGAERPREIMIELVNRATFVVQRGSVAWPGAGVLQQGRI
jgi:hypothetical protein